MPRSLVVAAVTAVTAAGCGHANVETGHAVSATEPDARQRALDADIAARAAPFVDAFTNQAAVLAPVIAPNIRGSTGFGLDYEQADDREHRIDALRDVESVNQWARAQPWCDGDRLVIGGISYGGYMTLLALGHQPALWRAGIDGSGMSNLRTMEQLEDQTIRSYDDTEFGVLGKDDALLVAWSSITAVHQIRAPVFVYQGVRDPVTPHHEADQIVAALRRRHVPVEYMLIANEGHGVTRRDNQIAYLARSYRFLSEHMKLAPP